jgi:hypothetical protein
MQNRKDILIENFRKKSVSERKYFLLRMLQKMASDSDLATSLKMSVYPVQEGL